ncbi:uncharacterized protein LOC108876346 [Lates japonicus]|uniref:G protein-regulated inducer of neurite outgrowth C-terminal domain-containing protein n=1 Tax=Lates japonicus TaxID=270547 RepID=A0AAD3NFH2_LATJO|nr:uncharacterized protein AKAME5_002223100 [Lates japonicus]
MARPGRPVSESYQPVCCSVNQSVSYSSEAGIVGSEDEDDQAPIFSLSKSSMDVVMATGPPHKRDPTWTRMDLRRSSSTNTHTEKLHPQMWQHVSTTNSHQLSLKTHNAEVQSPPVLSERWITSMQRWSGCSGSTHSRSSTPETIIWRGGTSRPSSLTQEAHSPVAPDSPMSKLASPPTTPSPLISPLHTPTLPPVDLLTSASPSTLSTNQQDDLLVSSPAPSPLPSPLQSHTSPLPSHSPNLLHLTSTEDEGFPENNMLSFQFPSPIPSSASLAEAGASSDLGCLVDDVIEEPQSPGGLRLSEVGGVKSPEQMFGHLTPHSPAEGQESGRGGVAVCHLELPWLPGQSCPAGRSRRSPLISSLSDTRLGDRCRCSMNSREGIARALKVEEATMTSKLKMVDAEVQTISPVGSWWNLKRDTSTSNMGSHSILGSPPGSRLNLKSSVGSNSNLVSPSSSMFPVSSGEEEKRGDDPMWDVDSPSSHDLERRRSCLKAQGEEKDELGRRSSMKQVQWDEDGMTWDIHGASVDPEELSMAIRKHLELQNSPRPLRRSSKKKKAPKPPLISNVVKAMTPELNPPVMIITSTCIVEDESGGTSEPYGRREMEEEGGGKKEETAEAAHRMSRAEAEDTKEEEGEEVYREEGASHTKSPSRGSVHNRTKSVIKSLRRPRWCGGSRKADD